MFLIRLFRFITGYVMFEGSSGFTERFINLCSAQNISLWDIKTHDDGFTAKTDIAGYKNIRSCAKKSGVRIRSREKHGLAFTLLPFFRRKGLIAGISVSVVLVYLLSSCIWTCDITGNSRLTDEQVMKIVQKHGVYPGCPSGKINLQDIRSDIKASVDSISWFSLNKDGCHISLIVSEKTGSTGIADTTTPCNIVSDTDGEVLKIEVKNGTAAAIPGNAIVKGELLISGVKERTDGSCVFVHASGNAIIRCNRSLSVKLDKNLKVKKISDVSAQYYVSLFGISVPVTLPLYDALINISESVLKYKDTVLPAGITAYEYADFCEEEALFSDGQLSLLGSYLLFCNESAIMQDACAEKKEIAAVFSSSDIKINGEYILHKKTGIEKYFEVSE